MKELAKMEQELVIGRVDATDIMYNIRKFDANEELTRDDGIYEDRGGFDLAIIKKCIVDFGDLFYALDKSGYSAERPPREIMVDLAENCLKVNPHFRDFWISGPGKVEKPDFGEISAKMAENRKNAKIAQKRDHRIRELEQKALSRAKNTILRIFDEMSNSEIAEKLDIFEIGVETLKNRNWTFWDCISIAEKLDLDVEVVFARFRHYGEGRGDQ
jgi:hypothetical protein